MTLKDLKAGDRMYLADNFLRTVVEYNVVRTSYDKKMHSVTVLLNRGGNKFSVVGHYNSSIAVDGSSDIYRTSFNSAEIELLQNKVDEYNRGLISSAECIIKFIKKSLND